MSGDPFDLQNPRMLAEEGERLAAVPRKIQKRKQDFAKVPMEWYEILKHPAPTGLTVLIAWYLCYLGWKNHGKPFKLPNGLLQYDGISRQTKWRALAELERRGLISIERRPAKSPIVHLLRTEGS
jgi:hypothetical protein